MNEASLMRLLRWLCALLLVMCSILSYLLLSPVPRIETVEVNEPMLVVRPSPPPPLPPTWPPRPWTLNTTTHVFFVNLDTRGDRKAEFIREMRRVGIPKEHIHRAPGVVQNNHARGCALAHAGAIQQMMDMRLSYAIFFEDDFSWRHTPNVTVQVMDSILASQVPWEVVLLAGYGRFQAFPDHPHLRRVMFSQTASAYMVTAAYARVLHHRFASTAAQQTNREVASKNDVSWDVPYNHIDQAWKIDQRRDAKAWFATDPFLGFQRSSFSDIQGKNVSYGF